MSSETQIVDTVTCIRVVDDNGKWIAGCGKGWTQPRGSRTHCSCGRRLMVVDSYVEIPLPEVLLGVPNVE